MGKILDLLKKKANNSDWFAPHKTIEARLAICEECEFFISQTSQCSKCMCFMKLKARFLKTTCPISKW